MAVSNAPVGEAPRIAPTDSQSCRYCGDAAREGRTFCSAGCAASYRHKKRVLAMLTGPEGA